jgi:hypothetical protein
MENLESLAKELILSPKKLNNYNKIFESFIKEIQNKNIKKINKISSLNENILKYYLKTPEIHSSKELLNFFNEKINILFNILFDFGKEDLNEETSEIIFNIFISYFDYNEENNKKNLMTNLLNLIILNKEFVEHEITLLFVSKFKNFFNLIFDILIEESNKIKEITTLYNLFNFLIAINDLENEEEKLKYQNIITILINNENFPEDLLKNFLINLNKVIIHNVNNPLIFSDYLINKASKGNIKKLEDFDNKIFALSTLFILLTKYKLDYDKYYELLYKLISIKLNNLTIFDSKYKNRIFKILELSLKSSQIPLIIICSFIKKLSRISLISNDSNIISIITLIILIIQNHPKTIGMLMYKRKVKKEKENLIENSTFDWNKFNNKIANKIKLEKENDIKNKEDNNIIELNEDNYTDMFNDNEINPYKTNAHFCSLWELYTLKNHFNMKIRKLVNTLSFNFLPREFALENIKEKELLFDIEKTNAHFYINE